VEQTCDLLYSTHTKAILAALSPTAVLLAGPLGGRWRKAIQHSHKTTAVLLARPLRGRWRKAIQHSDKTTAVLLARPLRGRWRKAIQHSHKNNQVLLPLGCGSRIGHFTLSFIDVPVHLPLVPKPNPRVPQ